MLVTPLDIVKLDSPLQWRNALLPMLVTLPGIVTLVSLLQLLNALLPMLVTPFGMLYDEPFPSG